MDWLRRNWPDLLIGVALVAVIAGIIATLLGGSIFDSLRGASRAPDVSQLQLPAASVESQEPVSPLAEAQQTEAAGEAAGETAVDVVVLDATAPDEVASPLGEAMASTPVEEAGDSPASTPSVVLLPPESAGVAGPETTSPETRPETTTAEVTSPDAASAETETLIPVEPAEAPPLEVVTPATVAAPAAEPWRIAVGSFRNRDNAERRAEEYRAEGHPVFIGVEGDISVVLVGPFADEAETRGLAEQFRGDGGEAFVYRYDADPEAAVEATSATAASPEPSGVATATEATDTPVTETAAMDTAATDTAAVTEAATEAATNVSVSSPESAGATSQVVTRRYLQVGAFNRPASAEPRKQRLEAMGYEVLSRTDDSGVVRLLIGPFDGEEMRGARERLDTQGIEHFPVD